MKEIRLKLQKKDEEKFTLIKQFLNENKDTGVLRNLINEKYQELKKLMLNKET